jgi:hypothetical protein
MLAIEQEVVLMRDEVVPLCSKFLFLERSFTNDLIPLEDLIELGRRGWLLYHTDTVSDSTGLVFTYKFYRRDGDVDHEYEYQELLVPHRLFAEDALHYASRGWTNVATFECMRNKESGLMHNRQRDVLPVRHWGYIYMKEIKN